VRSAPQGIFGAESLQLADGCANDQCSRAAWLRVRTAEPQWQNAPYHETLVPIAYIAALRRQD
jgi:hypothetical protein